MIALHLARQEGHVHSESQENLFLVRWLAGAEKQRRFSRDVATDIRWLLREGRSLGIRARLRSKLEYLWRAGSGDILAQTDMFRLTWGLDTLKGYRWSYHLLSDSEWSGQRRMRLSPDVNAVSLLRSSLNRAFADDGSQVYPVRVRVNGNVAALDALLTSCGWQLQQAGDGEYCLLAGAARLPEEEALYVA
ncbi:TPA: DUF2913 family protein [Salmonella enterica]